MTSVNGGYTLSAWESKGNYDCGCSIARMERMEVLMLSLRTAVLCTVDLTLSVKLVVYITSDK